MHSFVKCLFQDMPANLHLNWFIFDRYRAIIKLARCYLRYCVYRLQLSGTTDVLIQVYVFFADFGKVMFHHGKKLTRKNRKRLVVCLVHWLIFFR